VEEHDLLGSAVSPRIVLDLRSASPANERNKRQGHRVAHPLSWVEVTHGNKQAPTFDRLLLRMSEQLGVPLNQIVPTIELFDEGATCPSLRVTERRSPEPGRGPGPCHRRELAYFRELEDRRATVLQSIEEQAS
jgi:hypothetical protein